MCFKLISYIPSGLHVRIDSPLSVWWDQIDLCHQCTLASLHLLTCRVWSYGVDSVGPKVPPGLGGVSAEVPLQQSREGSLLASN